MRVVDGDQVADRAHTRTRLLGVVARMVVVALGVATDVGRVDAVLDDQVLLDRSWG